MKKVITLFKGLCTPAQVYLALSTISLLALLTQNCQNHNQYRVGTMVVQSPCHNLVYFALKILYVLVWTWILNKLCSKGFTTVSWLLVLLPFIGMFLVIGLLMLALLSRR